MSLPMNWNLLKNTPACGPPLLRVALEPFSAQALGWNNCHMLPAVTSQLRSFDRYAGWWAHEAGGASTGDNNPLGFCMQTCLALSWGCVIDHNSRRGTWRCLNGGGAQLSLILRGKKPTLKACSAERESSPSVFCFILLALIWSLSHFFGLIINLGVDPPILHHIDC